MISQSASELLEEIPVFQPLLTRPYLPIFPERIEADIDDFDDFVRDHVEALELPPSKKPHLFVGFKTRNVVSKEPMELMITREDGKFVITNLVLDAVGLGDSVNEAINDLIEYMIDQYKLLKKFHDDDRLTQYAKRLFEKYKFYLEERS